jgi:hypothetical protein
MCTCSPKAPATRRLLRYAARRLAAGQGRQWARCWLQSPRRHCRVDQQLRDVAQGHHRQLQHGCYCW